MTDFESRVADWLGTDEAVRRILAEAEPLPTESVPLPSSLGRALAADVRARWTLPPWDNAAMDGYAVRSEDIEGASTDAAVPLTVVGRVLAGESWTGTLGPREAVRIMTGGPVPEGADAVVRVEDTDRERTPGTVVVTDDRDVRRNVRPGGQDWTADDVVLTAGTTVHPGHVGVLAAAGATTLEVHTRPVVAILPTGDELFDIHDADADVGVPESNSHVLAAQTTAAGGIATRHGITADADEVLGLAIEESASADVLVTVGGASMGEGDRVKRVLDGLGYRPDFWRVRIRPGSPFSFGWLPRPGAKPQPVFGLPGNPASAFVTFEVFVRPFLRRIGGHAHAGRRRILTRAGESLHTASHLLHLLRVRVEGPPGEERAFSTGHQGSGLVQSLGRADGLAFVPEGVGTLDEGDPVEVLLLDDAR